MTAKWKLGDLIDLEYFLQQEDERSEESSEEDRKLYLKYLETSNQEPSDTISLRKGLYRYWLEKRKAALKQDKKASAVMPGEIFEEVYRLFIFIFLFTGMFLGGGAAFHLLSYDGTKPVNVTSYIGLFVICQILLVMIILIVGSIRGKKQGYLRTSLIYKAVANMLSKAIHMLTARAVKTISMERRNELDAAIGLVKGKQRVYGDMFYWPVFNLIQIGSIGINAGVISTTLLRVLAQDLAFGWASTIQFSAQTVFSFVKTISLPWSWFFSQDIAFPTLAQIEGSRILLKNGIFHLSTQDLVSWWPFLCLSVVFYGFLPRVILLSVGIIKGRKVISEFNFDTVACEKLMIKMNTPGLRTAGKEEFPHVRENHDETFRRDQAVMPRHALDEAAGAVVLIPTDIFSESMDHRLKDVVLENFGMRMIEKKEINIDPESDSRVIQDVADKIVENSKSKIVMLQEAWQPPIQETGMFIQALRQRVGKTVNILVLLVGKPKSGDIFTSAGEQDKQLWKKFVDKIGDPHLWTEAI